MWSGPLTNDWGWPDIVLKMGFKIAGANALADFESKKNSKKKSYGDRTPQGR